LLHDLVGRGIDDVDAIAGGVGVVAINNGSVNAAASENSFAPT
jgi:hypothetical protein